MSRVIISCISVNLVEVLSKVEREYSIGGSMFDFAEGENKIRILDLYYKEPVATHFLGRNVKPVVCYGVDEGCQYHGEMSPVDEEGNSKKPSIKFLAYILDVKRGGNRILLAKFPYTVIKAIVKLQKDEDYAFDGFPMPYDLKIEYDPNATGSAMYNTTPSPNRTDISEEVGKELLQKKPLAQIVEEWKEKAKAENNTR